MNYRIQLSDHLKENQAHTALGTFVTSGHVTYDFVRWCADITFDDEVLSHVELISEDRESLIRRLVVARLLDLVSLAQDSTSGSSGEYTPSNDAQFAHGLLACPLLDLLRLFDKFAQEWLRACSLQSSNSEGWTLYGGFNEEDYSRPDLAGPVYHGLCHWVTVLDGLAPISRSIPYIFSCFATRVTCGAVDADYEGFRERNISRRGQRIPGLIVRRLAERILSNPENIRTFADHFSPRHGPGAVAFWGRGGKTTTSSVPLSEITPTTLRPVRSNGQYAYNGTSSVDNHVVAKECTWFHRRIPPHEKDAVVLQSAYLREWIMRHGSLLPVQIVAALMQRTYSPLYRPGTTPMFLTSVPKTWKSRRIIGAESADRMWLQQGVRSGLTAIFRRDTFLRRHIRLEDASVNATLAMRGSAAWRTPLRSYATIDLSSASDYIGARFASAIFGKTFIGNVIRDTRPKRVIYEDGGIEDLHIFGLMGSAYTFPCQTLIFTLIVEEARQIAHRFPKWFGSGANSVYWIYGDDIVASIATAKAACWLLTKYGFKVNTRKTFIGGPFRESCGGEFFHGVEITPLKLPRAFLDGKKHGAEPKDPVGRLTLNASAAYAAEVLDGAAKLYERASDESNWLTYSPKVACVIRVAMLDYWGLRPECLASEGRRAVRITLCFGDYIDAYGDRVIGLPKGGRYAKRYNYQVIEEGYYYDRPVYDDIDVLRDGAIPYEEWLSRNTEGLETSPSYERRAIRIERRFLVVRYRLVEVRRLR